MSFTAAVVFECFLLAGSFSECSAVMGLLSFDSVVFAADTL